MGRAPIVDRGGAVSLGVWPTINHAHMIGRRKNGSGATKTVEDGVNGRGKTGGAEAHKPP